MGRAMLHLAIGFAEMERDLAGRERWRDWSGPKPPASTSAGARGSAGSGPRRYRTCASATASWGRIATITGLPGPGKCRHEGSHQLWNQTARITVFICLACEPEHELGYGYPPRVLRRPLAGTGLVRTSPSPLGRRIRARANAPVPSRQGWRPGPAVRPAPASRTLNSPTRRRQSM